MKGKNSFNNRSLHAIGDELNPYEKAITVIGKTLAPFDEDNFIPCFGFGDGKYFFFNWKCEFVCLRWIQVNFYALITTN